MPYSNQPDFVQQQYATSANLEARIALHREFSTSSEHFHDWLFKHVHLAENARVLEIGCGSGALWQSVYKRIPHGWHLILTDYSFGMATQARANLQPLVSRLQSPVSSLAFANCDAQSLPFSDATFDGIFANHMLYHIPDLHRALAELQRVLKHGGTLYAATNGLGHMGELDELRTSLTGEPPAADSPEHLFGLENGGAFLKQHFATVSLDVHDNNLRVTEVEPLVTYVNSGWMFKSATANQDLEQEFRRRVQHEIDTKGAFHITKSVGLFIAA